jgi:hypothetical protein
VSTRTIYRVIKQNHFKWGDEKWRQY